MDFLNSKKKIVVFLISFVCTILAMLLVRMIFAQEQPNEAGETYKLNTALTIASGSEKIISGNMYKCNQLTEEKGKIKYDFQMESYDLRSESFELSILCNYSQCDFYVEGKKFKKYRWQLKENSPQKKFSVMLDKSKHRSNSSIIFIIRQDITEKSMNNELVSESSNTIKTAFYVEDTKTQKNENLNLLNLINAREVKWNSDQNFTMTCLNRKQQIGIKVKPGENVSMRLYLPKPKGKYFLIWCYLNSDLTKINGKPYCLIKTNNESDKGLQVDISLVAPKKKEQYELEVYGQLKKNEVDGQEPINSFNRYTLEVEE